MKILTVIMPAYNEEACLQEAIREVQECILSKVPDSVLLVVNDGSTDATHDILEAMARRDPSIRPLHKPNGGHGDSLLTGAAHADTEYLLLLDADRQIGLERFVEHWNERAPNRVVCGVRQGRVDPMSRLAITRIVRILVRAIFGCRIQDANSPYKIVPKHIWERAVMRMPESTLTPSMFLAIMAARERTFEFMEVPVRHLPRRDGKTTLVSWRLLRFCLQATLQLLQFRVVMRRS